MRAALIKEFNKDFSIEEVDVPKIGDEEVLVRVKASCLCAADVKIRNGGLPSLKLPHIPGHEVVGEVAETGRDVENVRAGDRVVIYMYTVCGDCYACLGGRENLCVNIVRLGLERHGGHAEYVAVPERQLLPLPDNVSYEEGAAIPDAVCTMLHAIRDQARVQLNDYVVLMGVGGLGMQGVQVARLNGGRVIAVARHQEKLDAAKDLGAEWVFNGNDDKLVDKIIEVTGGRGADVVIDLVSKQETFQTAADAVKKGGQIIVVGSFAPEITVKVGQIMFKEVEVKGSLGMKKETIIDAIDLCK
ncbi:MAG: zinc-binding dehydrogenase, partial [Deltaproteobacteria bacterium]|nr:zinc-binding dehydrogenase [Deltaproteobacteria bacterium]